MEREQPGCLGTMRTDKNVEKVRTLVRTHCQLGIRIQVAQNYAQDKKYHICG
jgi:hypothetical protein